MRQSESGNAVIFILVTIALFAALAYTFMRSGQTGQSNLTAGQAKLAAQEMIDYAQSLERGTQKLLSRRCAETELEYDITVMPDCGANADSPSDGSCSLAGTAGANVAGQTFPAQPNMNVVVSAGASLEEIGVWDDNNGLVGQDIVVWFAPVDEKICRALNTILGNNFDPPVLGGATQNWCFNDDIGAGGNHFGTSGPYVLGALAGKRGGCFMQPDPDAAFHTPQGYNFYYVLHAR